MAQSHSQWTKSVNPPFSIKRINKIFSLNKTELLVVPIAFDYSIVNKLWIYNIFTANWTNLVLPNDLNHIDCKYYTASFDKDKSLLYIVGESGYILQINLKTKQFQLSSEKYHDASHSASLCINGVFHIFGGWLSKDKAHFIWDTNKQKLMKIHQFEKIKDGQLVVHSVNYLQKKKSVLITTHNSKNIYLYSLLRNECDLLSIKMCKTINWSRTVLTRNEQYLLILCNKNNINVLNLKTMIMRNNDNIQLPENGAPSIAIWSDNEREEILSFGFVRQCWNLSSFLQIRYPPFYLIKLIDSFFSVEIVHVIGPDIHWSINVDHIIT